MFRTLALTGALAMLLAGGLLACGPAAAETVTLPGISYEVLGSGPAAGPHPTRADEVTMRYIGRFTDGTVFSTSPDDGKGISTFGVKAVIPGMSAALQLMRPGDRWRITMPPYLAYGPGRPYTAPAGAATQAVQQRGIPPNATLVFDVDLVSIVPGKTP